MAPDPFDLSTFRSTLPPMLGLDIGGANLKIADGRGYARSSPFALWSAPSRLSSHLRELLSDAPESDALAVTMTGELCDCFQTKAEGVRHIVASVASVADGRSTVVYLTDGRLVSIDEAADQPHNAAASNWHVLAAYSCRYVESGAGLVVDIGSTTTDIVPLSPADPTPSATDDTSRLVAGELVYSGVGRTPICAMVDSLPHRGKNCPVAAEFFAQAADAYVTLSEIPDNRTDTDTADGRPRTKSFARARLARSICADPTAFSALDARAASMAIRAAQIDQISTAVRRVASSMPVRPATIVLGGAGEFLARRVVSRMVTDSRVVSLGEELGFAVSQSAPAHALAVLARERSSVR